MLYLNIEEALSAVEYFGFAAGSRKWSMSELPVLNQGN
jgi:hypothetical protein